MAGVVCGIGGAIARAAVDRQVRSVVTLVNIAQRSAAASERARLARELQDSLTKTLRGVSFAALALPSSLRRHPELAEQLATTVSVGVEAAAQQARGTGHRPTARSPGRAVRPGHRSHLRGLVASDPGYGVELARQPTDPAIAVRYELLRILGEALTNVERHANAHRVVVTLRQDGDSLRFDGDRRRSGAAPTRPRGPREGHFGIVGMSERARSFGGTLATGPSPSGGARVSVAVPMRLADAAPDVSAQPG